MIGRKPEDWVGAAEGPASLLRKPRLRLEYSWNETFLVSAA